MSQQTQALLGYRLRSAALVLFIGSAVFYVWGSVRDLNSTLDQPFLLNRKGPTWRKLAPEVQAAVVDAASALACMQANSSVIKRPVIEWGSGALTVGFVPEEFAKQTLAPR